MKQLFCLILALPLFSCFAQIIVIRNVTVLPMSTDTTLTQQNVWIEQGKITKIEPTKKVKASSKIQVIDGTNKYLMPALADMHVHLAKTSDLAAQLKANVAAGVVRIRVMNYDDDQFVTQDYLKNTPLSISPNIYHSLVISSEDKYTAQQWDSVLFASKKRFINRVKMFSIENEAAFDAVMAAAKKYDIMVFGHYPTYKNNGQSTAIGFDKVLTSGFRSIEHLGGYSSIADKTSWFNVINFTQKENVYNCPTLDWDVIGAYLQYPETYKQRPTYLSRNTQTRAAWDKSITESVVEKDALEIKKSYLPVFERKQKTLKLLAEKKCPLLVGSDPGATLQAHGFNMYEEMFRWQEAGVDAYTILKSATYTPACFFKEEHTWGSVAVNQKGDVILLTQNPLKDLKQIQTIETIIFNGKVISTKSLQEP